MLTLSACGNVEENKEVTEPDSDTVTEVVKSATESGSETETVKPVTESEPEPQTVESATEPAEEYSKTLVVYFSHTGNTNLLRNISMIL